MTPDSLPSSSTTGTVSRLYLSKISVTRSRSSLSCTWINVSETRFFNGVSPDATNRFAVLRAQLFDNVGQVGGMNRLQQLAGYVQAQAALRVGLQDVAKLPADGVGWDGTLELTDPAPREHPANQPAEDAAKADVHLQDVENIGAVLLAALERDIVDAHHFTAMGIDDLLIEQIADNA